jgi:hypothetical protein
MSGIDLQLTKSLMKLEFMSDFLKYYVNILLLNFYFE